MINNVSPIWWAESVIEIVKSCVIEEKVLFKNRNGNTVELLKTRKLRRNILTQRKRSLWINYWFSMKKFNWKREKKRNCAGAS